MDNNDIKINNFTAEIAEVVTMATNGNETGEYIDEHASSFQTLENVVAVVVPVFFSIVCLIGFFGNNLVILVVTFNKQMRNTTNLLILNLAVADVLFIVCCVPFTATSYALPHSWPFGDAWCRMVQYLIYFLALVSIYTLVLMSLDRFLAVVYAVESMTWRTEGNCKIAIAATWIICAIFCTPLIFSHGESENISLGISYCGFLHNQTVPYLPEGWDVRWNLKTFTIAFFNGGYVFPLLLICGMYSIMLRRLWRQGPAGQASAESIRNKKRVVKMVLVVIVIFALSWLPIQVVLVLRSLDMFPISPFSVGIQIFSNLLSYGNSCVNPILYAFLSEPFRRGFCAVVSCIRPSGPHGLHGNNGNAPTNRFQKPKKLQHTDPPPKNTIALTINHTVIEDNGVSKNNLGDQNSKQVAQVHVQEQNALLEPNLNKETNNV